MQKAEVENNKAAIDNDFLQHLLEIKKSTDLIGLIKRFFSALGVSVSMHPLVYKHEASVISNKNREKLFDEETISVVPLDRLWNEDGGREYYFIMVKDLYKRFTGKEYPCQEDENSWKARESLGEVHTVVMCKMMSYHCFLSDDRDAISILQRIINQRWSHPITIHNRKDRCEYLKTKPKEERENLTTTELSWISHSP